MTSKQNNLSKFKKISIPNLVFFVLWPLGTLIANLKNRNVFEKKTIFLLFLTYLGFMFIYDDPNKIDTGSDSGRWAAQFMQAHIQNNSLGDIFKYLYKTDSDTIDIYSPILMWLVSRLTGDPRFFFMTLSFILSWFYINNIFIVLSHTDNKLYKNNLALKLIIACLIILIPSWFINAYRFWTASHVFIYGLLLILLLDKKIGYFFIVGSALIHFSFIYLVLLFVTFQFIPKWSFKLFFWGFILTSFTSELKLDIIQVLNVSFLPDFISGRFETYTNKDYIDLLSERTFAWHTVLASSLGRYIPLALMLLLYYSGFNNTKSFPGMREMKSRYLNIFLFALFAGIITNIIGGVAELGRVMIVLRFLFYTTIILNYTYLKKFNFLLNAMIPFILFYVIFQIRVGTDYYGIWLLFGNPFLGLLVETQTPIIELFKDFIK